MNWLSRVLPPEVRRALPSSKAARRFARRFLVALVVSSAFWVIIYGGYWMASYRLATRGIPTIGQVIAKRPLEHGAALYSYTVGGVSYNGRDVFTDFDRLNVGDGVQVFYDPMDPKNSSLVDPKELLRTDTISIIFGTLFFAVAVPACLEINSILSKELN